MATAHRIDDKRSRKYARTFGRISTRHNGAKGKTVYAVVGLQKEYFHLESEEEAKRALKNLLLYWYKGVGRRTSSDLEEPQAELVPDSDASSDHPITEVADGDDANETDVTGIDENGEDKDCVFKAGYNIYASHSTEELDSLYFDNAFADFKNLLEQETVTEKYFLHESTRLPPEHLDTLLRFKRITPEDVLETEREQEIKEKNHRVWESFNYIHSKRRFLGLYSSREMAALVHDLAKLKIAGTINYRTKTMLKTRFCVSDLNFPEILMIRDTEAEKQGAEAARILHQLVFGTFSFSLRDPDSGKISNFPALTKNEMMAKQLPSWQTLPPGSQSKTTGTGKRKRYSDDAQACISVMDKNVDLPAWNLIQLETSYEDMVSTSLMKKTAQDMKQRPVKMHYYQVLSLVPYLSRQGDDHMVLQCLATGYRLYRITIRQGHDDSMARIFAYIFRYGLKSVYRLSKAESKASVKSSRTARKARKRASSAAKKMKTRLLVFTEALLKETSGLRYDGLPSKISRQMSTRVSKNVFRETFNVKCIALTCLIFVKERKYEEALFLIDKYNLNYELVSDKLLQALAGKLCLLLYYQKSSVSERQRFLTSAFTKFKGAFTLEPTDGIVLLYMVLTMIEADKYVRQAAPPDPMEEEASDVDSSDGAEEEVIDVTNFKLFPTINKLCIEQTTDQHVFKAGMMLLEHYASPSSNLVRERVFLLKSWFYVQPENPYVLNALLELTMEGGHVPLSLTDDSQYVAFSKDFDLSATPLSIDFEEERLKLDAKWMTIGNLSSLLSTSSISQMSRDPRPVLQDARERSEEAGIPSCLDDCSSIQDENLLAVALEVLIYTITSLSKKCLVTWAELFDDPAQIKLETALFVWRNFEKVLALNSLKSSKRILKQENVMKTWRGLIYGEEEDILSKLSTCTEKLAQRDSLWNREVKNAGWFALFEIQVRVANRFYSSSEEDDDWLDESNLCLSALRAATGVVSTKCN